MNVEQCDHGYLPKMCAHCWQRVEYVVKAPEPPAKPQHPFKPLPVIKAWST
jgi:hypothetical protein